MKTMKHVQSDSCYHWCWWTICLQYYLFVHFLLNITVVKFVKLGLL